MRFFLTLLLFTSWTPAHKFYVSMTDIEWEASEQVMGITSRFFVDDLERALDLEGNVKIHEKNSPELFLMIQGYYLNHFELWDDEGKITIEFIGYELENDLIWCYAQCNHKPDGRSLSIKADWLCERFEDQSNIVHLKDPEGMKTLILNAGNTRSSFDQ